jgi:hypothetical protein
MTKKIKEAKATEKIDKVENAEKVEKDNDGSRGEGREVENTSPRVKVDEADDEKIGNKPAAYPKDLWTTRTDRLRRVAIHSVSLDP